MSSSSLPRRPPSRPTTPLRQHHRPSRPSSRSSFHSSHPPTPLLHASSTTEGFPVPASSNQPLIQTLEPAFAELADSLADLEANWMHLQVLHESLGRFGESFASFLYGLNLTAFCVDFPETPIPESTKRMRTHESQSQSADPSSATLPPQPGSANPSFPPPSASSSDIPTQTRPLDVENTFMTSDTSFISHPPPLSSTKGTPAPAPKDPVTPAPVRRGRGRGAGAGGAGGDGRGGAAGRGGGGGRGIPVVRGRGGRGTAMGGTRGGRGEGQDLPRGRGLGTGRGR